MPPVWFTTQTPHRVTISKVHRPKNDRLSRKALTAGAANSRAVEEVAFSLLLSAAYELRRVRAPQAPASWAGDLASVANCYRQSSRTTWPRRSHRSIPHGIKRRL